MASNSDEQYRMQVQQWITVTEPQRLGVLTDLNDGAGGSHYEPYLNMAAATPHQSGAVEGGNIYMSSDADAPPPPAPQPGTWGSVERSQNNFWQSQAATQTHEQVAAAQERMRQWMRNIMYLKGPYYDWDEPAAPVEPGMEGF